MTWHKVALQHLNLFEEAVDKLAKVKSINIFMEKGYWDYPYGSFQYGSYIAK